MSSPRVYLPERAGDFERWMRGEIAGEVVKQKKARAIWRVPVGSPGLYVKRFPPSLFKDRAVGEARLLEWLAAAGIPCPRLVATARDSKGAYVVTEEIAGAAVLKDVLEAGGPPAREAIVAFAKLVRRLHDAGFDHEDLHIGNVLVRSDGLFVLDVHRARKHARLSDTRRIRGVAFSILSFTGLLPRTEELRFATVYGYRSRADRNRVIKEFRRQLDDYYSRRQKRCVEGGGGFSIRDGVYYRDGTDLDALLEWVKSDRMTPVKVENSRGLYRSDDGLFLKRTRAGRAVRVWRNAQGLAVRRIGTPRLLACGRSWVVGDWIPAPDLLEYVRTRFPDLDRSGRDEVLFTLARTVRKMHERGAFHADLKATNVLVENGTPLFVDLDRVDFGSTVPEPKRILNLAQLSASIPEPLTRTDRLRFLSYYFGSSGPAAKERRRWIREIMKVTVSRRHRWPPGKG